jgi:hypothetical protein
MPLGNAMLRHGDSLRNRDVPRRLCPYQHTELPRRILSQSPSTHNAYDLGKFRACFPVKPWHVHGNAVLSKGGFYPNLAKVGKEILKEGAWLEYAVARRFVQCSGE